MNAPALNLFASPQGAAPVAGAATGVLGVFEALLATMTGEAEPKAAAPEAKTDEDAEPATDAAVGPMMFATLLTPAPTPVVMDTQEATASAAAPVSAPALPEAALPETAAPQVEAEAPAAAPDAGSGVKTAPPAEQSAKATPQAPEHDPKVQAPAQAPASTARQADAAPTTPAAPQVQAAPVAPAQAAQAAPVEAAAEAVAPPPPVAEAKPAKPEARVGRAEGKPASPTALSQTALSQTAPSQVAAADADEPAPPVAADEAGVEPAPADVFAAPADLPDAPVDAKPQTASAASTAAPIASAALAAAPPAPPAPVRGAPETVAKLAAGILSKLENNSTRFEIGLDPLGLGHVDVSLEIGADGVLTAQLAFDTPQAAAELRGRSGELRQALEQAGFELSRNSLSFDVAGQGQQQQRHDTDRQPRRGARAFEAVMASDDIAPPTFDRRRTSGVDIRI